MTVKWNKLYNNRISYEGEEFVLYAPLNYLSHSHHFPFSAVPQRDVELKITLWNSVTTDKEYFGEVVIPISSLGMFLFVR
jgi:hypothetical protein